MSVARGIVVLALGCGACQEVAYGAVRHATTTKPSAETDEQFSGRRPPRTQSGPTETRARRSSGAVAMPSSGARTGTVVARHVLVQWKGCMDASTLRTRAEAARMADEAWHRLHQGEDFAAVAAALSDDVATASRGGDVGAFTGGMRDATFEGRTFSLEVGEVSEVFETDAGYEIVQRTK